MGGLGYMEDFTSRQATRQRLRPLWFPCGSRLFVARPQCLFSDPCDFGLVLRMPMVFEIQMAIPDLVGIFDSSRRLFSHSKISQPAPMVRFRIEAGALDQPQCLPLFRDRENRPLVYGSLLRVRLNTLLLC